ncbi:HAD family hydrolase [Candidatus Acetothermia bacterium]|nr:HAD family hydrolase [Candidatus Acetothermia bacterium]
MIRALIFDLDGMIVDTESPSLQSWQELFQRYGCELPLSEWAKCIGTGYVFDPLEYLESQLGYGFNKNRAELGQKRFQREVELANKQSARPGVQEYIADAKKIGLRLGVASSSPRDWVEGHLLRLGLMEHFDAIKCRDDVTNVKPDPELYLAALDALKVQASETIALEDSPNGILAAKRAGLFCVAVPNPITAQLQLEGADVRLGSLAELPLAKLLVEAQRNYR